MVVFNIPFNAAAYLPSTKARRVLTAWYVIDICHLRRQEEFLLPIWLSIFAIYEGRMFMLVDGGYRYMPSKKRQDVYAGLIGVIVIYFSKTRGPCMLRRLS